MATELEIGLAERLVDLIPCAEKVRFGKNGTDATSAAVRLARAFTARDHIFALGYHGWQDWYIGATVRNLGVPAVVRDLTHKLPFNNIEALHKAFAAQPDAVAAVIMEPSSSEEPAPGYLQAVKDLAHKNGALLIFDEVITGFRFPGGSAQKYYGVTPDMAAFGKGMGNGMPISAVLGRADIMDMMEKIFYSGTFGGETLSLAASIATIDKISRENVIDKIWATGTKLAEETQGLINRHGLLDHVKLMGAPSWKVLSFADHPAASKEAIKTRFMIEMLAAGVLVAGSHNICYAHTSGDMAQVVRAWDGALAQIARDLADGKLVERLEVPPIIPVFQVRG